MPNYICNQCGVTFFRSLSDAHKNITQNRKPFCSRKCSNIYQTENGSLEVKCCQCGKIFRKNLYQIKKTNNNFCSRRCSGIYNAAHKTTGSTRSKLEQFIQQHLTILYPDLTILYNDVKTINAELDVYIPSLNLAFELNGIFHYEPIYGSDKLHNMQNNDKRKIQACLEQNIELCVIDTSGQKYFKESTSVKYLNIILDIIKQKSGMCRSSTDTLLITETTFQE